MFILLHICHPNWAAPCDCCVMHCHPNKPEIGQGPMLILLYVYSPPPKAETGQGPMLISLYICRPNGAGPRACFVHLQTPQNRKSGRVLCSFYYTFTPQIGQRPAYFVIHLQPPPKPEIGQGPVLILLYIRHPHKPEIGQGPVFIFLHTCHLNWAAPCLFCYTIGYPKKRKLSRVQCLFYYIFATPPSRKLGRAMCLLYCTFATRIGQGPVLILLYIYLPKKTGNRAGSCAHFIVPYIGTPPIKTKRNVGRVLCLFNYTFATPPPRPPTRPTSVENPKY